jgi:hypothetical protein
MTPKGSCKLIYDKVCKGLARRNEIKPYKVNGPVELILFDSDNHAPPLKTYGEAATAPTISEAFRMYGRNLPWSKKGLQYVDGFQFPVAKD